MDHDEAERGVVQEDAELTQQSKQEGKGGSDLGRDKYFFYLHDDGP
jgi:hypothetical protein